jgi:hypothetical protein
MFMMWRRGKCTVLKFDDVIFFEAEMGWLAEIEMRPFLARRPRRCPQ